MKKDKIDLFEEGLSDARKEGICIDAFAHEFDFSDRELLQVSVKRCPRCGGIVDCVDGHIVCLNCDWELR